jgi:hypothetical protein
VRLQPCILVLQTLDGADDGVAAISFGDPFLRTDPAFPVLADTTVTVTVGGMPSQAVTVGLCVEPFAVDACVAVGTIALDPWGGGQLTQVGIPPSLIVSGTQHDCATGVCAWPRGTTPGSTRARSSPCYLRRP